VERKGRRRHQKGPKRRVLRRLGPKYVFFMEKWAATTKHLFLLLSLTLYVLIFNFWDLLIE
jgi:hypothetical protein